MVVAVFFVPLIWIKGGTQRTGGVIGLALAAVALPLVLALVTKRRISGLGAPPPCTPQEPIHEAAPPLTTTAAAEQEKDILLATRPRKVRFTSQGYAVVFGMVFATQLVAGSLFVAVLGISGQWHFAILKNVLALLLWSSLLWRCVSFFRNRIRERRLFSDGELSHGFVVNRAKTGLGTQIVFRYRDFTGKLFQNHATDFSGSLYEDMPLHVFYNQLDSCHSAALESSLFRVG